ncbi:hypothetical protein EJV47_14380 [Hymenobacter gummosus]|uniref:DUF2490 domain-containing protein n=1 Tax=Hymenobacter gummosus TaxID=1776032 RepID=A0A3S0H644_9BACT|nr:hypothetical protein [Hymenobacter gummosus]RTQ49322.1 hypothetical protein EJV47_14380 [Hymenobacter gummosus]
MNLFRPLLVSGLLVLTAAGTTLAQRKLSTPLIERTELQLELPLRNGDYFWTSLHAQHSFGNGLDGGAFQFNWLQGGYEHFLSDGWSLGGNARLNFYESFGNIDVSRIRTEFRPEVLLRHRGDVFGLTFGQRLSVEYLTQKAPARNLGMARLRLDLERVVSVGEKLKLRPRLAYEAAMNIRLQPPDDAPEERTVDYAQWRAEVGLRLSDHFDLTPYVARQSTFAVYLPQYDPAGNLISGGRTNVRTPVVGLDLRYTLFPGGSPFERVQLPTQH